MEENKESQYLSKLTQLNQEMEKIDVDLSKLDENQDERFYEKKRLYFLIESLRENWGNSSCIAEMEEDFSYMDVKEVEEYETRKEDLVCRKKLLEQNVEDCEEEYQKSMNQSDDKEQECE